jgi:threonine aldolase
VLPLLSKKYSYATIEAVDEAHTAVRFCTSWATRPMDVDRLIEDLRTLL